jgi:hypothetical protein
MMKIYAALRDDVSEGYVWLERGARIVENKNKWGQSPFS